MRLALLSLLLLAGCREQGPAAPTAEQSGQLNEAEDMLNTLDAHEKGPETNASGPPNESDENRT
jgi:hypothetical protein